MQPIATDAQVDLPWQVSARCGEIAAGGAQRSKPPDVHRQISRRDHDDRRITKARKHKKRQSGLLATPSFVSCFRVFVIQKP
jgi:hypothetical protein